MKYSEWVEKKNANWNQAYDLADVYARTKSQELKDNVKLFMELNRAIRIELDNVRIEHD